MVRVKRGIVKRQRHERILRDTKGFVGAHSRLFRTAKGQLMKARVYAYRGRRERRRSLKKVQVCRLNSLARLRYGVPYSQFINALRSHRVAISAKMLTRILILSCRMPTPHEVTNGR